MTSEVLLKYLYFCGNINFLKYLNVLLQMVRNVQKNGILLVIFVEGSLQNVAVW